LKSRTAALALSRGGPVPFRHIESTAVNVTEALTDHDRPYAHETPFFAQFRTKHYR
jgi:hypothetical protein